MIHSQTTAIKIYQLFRCTTISIHPIDITKMVVQEMNLQSHHKQYQLILINNIILNSILLLQAIHPSLQHNPNPIARCQIMQEIHQDLNFRGCPIIQATTMLSNSRFHQLLWLLSRSWASMDLQSHHLKRLISTHSPRLIIISSNRNCISSSYLTPIEQPSFQVSHKRLFYQTKAAVHQALEQMIRDNY